MNFYVNSILIIFFFVGCQEKKLNMKNLTKKEVEEILGVDENKNGVPDDYEEWVHSLGHDEKKVEAYMLYGKWQIAAYRTVLENRIDRIVSEKWYNAYNCMLHRIKRKDGRYTDYNEIKKAEHFFKNTKEKIILSGKFQREYFKGSVSVELNDGEDYCRNVKE